MILYPTCRAKVIGDRADYFMLIEKDMEDHWATDWLRMCDFAIQAIRRLPYV